MGSRRKTGGAGARLPELSRRAVLGAASASPLSGGLARASKAAAATANPLDPATTVYPRSPVSEVTTRCDEWLALDAKIDSLSLRWSHLETVLVREKNWSEMLPDEREALPPSEEMAAIDEQLHGLFEQRRRRLDALPGLVSRDVRAVASKLAVAVRVMRHERADGFEVIESATRELRSLCCAHCGEPIVGN
ncbi:MAG: hypothetical protein JWR80_5824 [Bradyrhizobium sp.]|nr:hypothetical protein [Bradyrhizobium sp.]